MLRSRWLRAGGLAGRAARRGVGRWRSSTSRTAGPVPSRCGRPCGPSCAPASAASCRAINHEEGEEVSEHGAVAVLEIPDLDSKIAGKRAEIRESEAKLRLLEAGPRAEEMPRAARPRRAGDGAGASRA